MLRQVLTRLPVSSDVVSRYVPGETVGAAVAATRLLVEDGLMVTVGHLGAEVADEDAAEASVLGYLDLLEALGKNGLARHAELSVKLSSLGHDLPGVGAKLGLENARRLCRAARNAGTTLTLSMEDASSTDRTLTTLRELRKDHPETGIALQANLRRTEDDCRALAFEGSRVRLCKGAYTEAAEVAFPDRHEVDKSFVRCLKVLMAGQGYPMVATHDPRLVRIAGALATRYGRDADSYEYQLLHGVRPEEQRRLVAAGERVRVFVPYGEDWHPYLLRRLAGRPANLPSFLRSLILQK